MVRKSRASLTYVLCSLRLCCAGDAHGQQGPTLPSVFELFTSTIPTVILTESFESLVPYLQTQATAVLNLSAFISDTPVNMIPKAYVQYCLSSLHPPLELQSHTVYIDSLASGIAGCTNLMRIMKKHYDTDPLLQKFVTICHIPHSSRRLTLSDHYITASLCIRTHRLTIVDGFTRTAIRNWADVTRRYLPVAKLTVCAYATFRPSITPVRIQLRGCIGGQVPGSVDCGPLAIMHATAELTSPQGTVGIKTTAALMQTVRNSIVCMMAAVQKLGHHIDYLPPICKSTVPNMQKDPIQEESGYEILGYKIG
jgi:hypothetical protein